MNDIFNFFALANGGAAMNCPNTNTGLGKKVGPRFRVSRLLTPSGRDWQVHAT